MAADYDEGLGVFIDTIRECLPEARVEVGEPEDWLVSVDGPGGPLRVHVGLLDSAVTGEQAARVLARTMGRREAIQIGRAMLA